ncbi:FeS assembly SUF system regulator [Natronocella acetinitrilica]|jgi:FeS assembly SUF system regulator|uniref:FeS assembly SUF system regulator n=1 Tax=Natronocella acetinitrilica TaxID=414046 RepID=A0AAE3G6V1_9GAMM|nr:SUF system Fe-S cluster assembly regulator [Natronocella acetinitrilica]MCP1674937.1 FeS assembly SUF system regulator [Natronocella acetinitrilica]
MLRINRETDYATAILSLMARQPQERYSAAWLSSKRSLPAPVVSKILKQLVRAEVLVSHRGAKGGYSLARPAEDISIAAVINAIEGPIALTDCIEGGNAACQYSAHCAVSHNWSRINDVFQTALEAVSLKDMSAPLPAEHPSLRALGERVKTAVS